MSSPRTRHAPIAADARHARWAVSLIFFLNGASFCAILPRYPQLVESIGLSNGSFGLAVGLGPIGGLAAGLLAAPLMARWGSARVAVTFQVVASTVHLLVYTSATWLWLAVALFLAAASDAITDVSMNAHGMRVERRYRRSILNSYHGWWSLGAVTGGLLGSACAQLAVPLWIQGLVGLVVFGALAVGSRRFLLGGHDSTERRPAVLEAGAAAPSPASAGTGGESAAAEASASGPVDPGTAEKSERIDAAARGRGRSRHAATRGLLAIAALGLVLVFAGATEDAGNTWGALFMRDTFAATPFLAGLAFVALQGTQTIGRFVGDGVVDRLGDRLTARLGALLSGAGMAFALLLPHPVTALIGFACAGWGIATLFPAAFRAADEMEGVPHGLGITVVGWFARIGFFVTPPIVGALADALTLRYALWLVPVYALGILAFSGALATCAGGGGRAEESDGPAGAR
ncbi:MFS transporter [Brachybacterium endophyticum]|uniref:MFS transporter n=1 Tax=Brachybacterium endophyticum TaxID=2182385 RepID=A0A2U2RM07_9MICO|nr:MFS transporter [Brachybacterium endophyticum]PWH06900.1 MFS transporter [Brachybacterium endophyticum]